MVRVAAHDKNAQPELAMVRGLHTFIWLVVEASFVYLLASVLLRRTGRSVSVAAAVVAAETAVFVSSGFRCPLTGVARRMGAASGSVTDIWLPTWFARRLPVIHAPLLLLAGILFVRNRRRAGS